MNTRPVTKADLKRFYAESKKPKIKYHGNYVFTCVIKGPKVKKK